MKKSSMLMAVILLLVAVFGMYVWVNQPYWELENRVSSFESAEDFKTEFGDPRYVYRSGRENYYVEGYSYKNREITGRVEIYFPTLPGYEHLDFILYVYYSQEGSVEEIYVGGS